MNKILVAPSILSSNFARLEDELKKIEDSEADMVHIDVMDGNFVPNITIGPVIVEAIRRSTSLPLDVHLMIENPHNFIKDFVDAGSDIITIHTEAYGQASGIRYQALQRGSSKSVTEIDKVRIKEVLYQIKALGKKAGLSLNPDTDFCIQDVLKEVSIVLIMSVHPGFGGQGFIETVIPKIQDARRLFSGDIEVDGGINDKNVQLVLDAGANVLVAGSYFFGAKDAKEAVKRLRGLV